MPKKKTKKKLSTKQTFLLVLAAIFLFTLPFLMTKYFLDAYNDRQLLREQKARLDRAYEDIDMLSKDILGDLEPSKVSAKELRKECGESSAKYGRGTITCRSTFYVLIHTNKEVNELIKSEDKLYGLVKANSSFTSVRSPRAGLDYLQGNRFYGITSEYMMSAKTDCDFQMDTYTNQQYKAIFDDDITSQSAIGISLSCREITKEPFYPLAN